MMSWTFSGSQTGGGMKKKGTQTSDIPVLEVLKYPIDGICQYFTYYGVLFPEISLTS
jgi:hypothetical protein